MIINIRTLDAAHEYAGLIALNSIEGIEFFLKF